VLTCTAEAANGGTFLLVDPNSDPVGTLVLAAGDPGQSAVFTLGGLQITITDGDNDFDTDDFLTLTVALEGTGDETTAHVAPFVSGGADGFEVPKYVLTYPVTSARQLDVSVTAAGENTGDGTVTATVADPDTVKLGPYVLTATAEEDHGGTFTLTDPEGVEVSDSVVMDAADGGETVFTGGGVRLVITDGDEDFDTGDEFTILVTQSVSKRGVRVLCEGEVSRDRLIIHADGDNSNVDAVVRDQLRDFGIVPTPVQQLAQLDNQ